MTDLPTNWSALCALVFLLGLRHGLDADHLAAIDGLTRAGTRAGRRFARWSGLSFSLGHGAVVLAVAAAAGSAGAHWVPPVWFETLGGLLSFGFLALIGVLNLRAVLAAPANAPVALVGLRGRLVQRLLGRVGVPAGAGAVALVGALFALSFDTLSQAALFSVMAVPHGGVGHALVLGVLFVLGMVASDAANGRWVARMIDRSDRRAVVASRTMTLAVASVSLLVAALGLARMGSETVGHWLEANGLAVGLGVMLLVAGSYLAACRAAGPERSR